MLDQSEVSRQQSRDRRTVESFWDTRASGTAKKILIGATLAFADLGYHGASTREVAARASMSPAAVYIHFESKEDLFFRISESGHRAALRELSDAVALSSDPVQRLRLGIAAFASFHAEMNVIVRTVQYELRVLSGERFAQVAAIRREIDATVREVLVQGRDQGVFDISDLDGTTLLLLSFCIDISRWYHAGSTVQRSPSAIGLQYSDLALRLVNSR